MSISVKPGQVFRKPFLIALSRLAVVGLKIAACKYWDSSGFEVCAIMLCTTFSNYCGPRGTSHIPVLFFWSLWLFLLHYSGWMFLVCLVWWCIHHHIEPPMISMGLSEYLVKCGSVSLVCLDLVSGVLLCVWNPQCFYLVVFLSFHFTYYRGHCRCGLSC